MTKQRYSSREQEQFFKPLRVRLMKQQHRRLGGGYHLDWQPIIQNMITHEIVASLDPGVIKIEGQRKRKSCAVWSDRSPPENWYKSMYYGWTKAEAIALCKEAAVERQLPFDLQADILPGEIISHGPRTACLLCGKKEMYTRENFVCDSCRVTWHDAQEAESEKIVLLVPDRVVPGTYLSGTWSDHKNFDPELLEIAAGLVGATYSEYTPYEKLPGEKRHIKRPHMSLEARYRKLHTTESQADAFQALVEWLTKLMESVFLEGKRYGSSLLNRLAVGEIHPDDFTGLRDIVSNDPRELKKARKQ